MFDPRRAPFKDKCRRRTAPSAPIKVIATAAARGLPWRPLTIDHETRHADDARLISDPGPELRRRAEGLVQTMRERAPEAEELRRLPTQTLADFDDAGFLRALRPIDAGGLGTDLQTFADITRILGRGDASAGWVAGLFLSHVLMLSKLGTEAQEEIFGDRAAVSASATTSPPGIAVPAEGGWTVSGRWRFASGIDHAEWAVVMALADSERMLVAVPTAELTIHDTWYVPGMKATGSKDIEAVELFVPEPRVTPFAGVASDSPPGVDSHHYPLLRYPLSRVFPLIHSAVAVGVADAALDLFLESVETRTRQQTRGRVIEEEAIHEIYARAFLSRRSAELLLADAVAIADEGYAEPGSDLSPERRAAANLANVGAALRAFETVDLLGRAAGASVQRSGHPIERICRDTQVMRTHGLVDWVYHGPANGRILLGMGYGDLPADAF